MARLVVLSLLLVAVCVYGFTSKPQQCGPNERWNECAVVKSCEPKCGQDSPTFCPAICASRCQCVDGYKRNLNTNLCVSDC